MFPELLLGKQGPVWARQGKGLAKTSRAKTSRAKTSRPKTSWAKTSRAKTSRAKTSRAKPSRDSNVQGSFFVSPYGCNKFYRFNFFRCSCSTRSSLKTSMLCCIRLRVPTRAFISITFVLACQEVLQTKRNG